MQSEFHAEHAFHLFVVMAYKPSAQAPPARCIACMCKARLPAFLLWSVLSVHLSAQYQMTALHAGPNGASVREVCRQTGADIKSWTDQSKDEASRSPRPTRTFVIEAHPSLSSNVTACVDIPSESCLMHLLVRS